jgi:hypothetical protein
MDPSLWKANRRSQALKVMIDGVRGKMLPQFIGEHKAAVLPGRTRPKAPPRLTAPLAAKQFHHEVGGCNSAPLIIFQGHKAVAAFPGFIFELPPGTVGWHHHPAA